MTQLNDRQAHLRTAPFAALACCALLAITSCDPFPRDPNDTTQHIMTSGQFHAAVVESENEVEARDFIAHIEKAAGATAVIETGDASQLLHQLVLGDLDVVAGPFALDSPWKDEVDFNEDPHHRGLPEDTVVTRVATRKGENRWFILVNGAVRKK